MTSLATAYDQNEGEVSRRRLVLGTGLFVAGALLVLVGIASGATAVLTEYGFSVGESREIAGVLAGVGIPAVFVGIFTVLPANNHQRAAAAAGAGVAVLGVTLFRIAYPAQWLDANLVPTTFGLVVIAIYFLGTITTFWCLFTAAATFKRRNDPGGTVSLTYTDGGETKTVRVAAEDASRAKQALGSLGSGAGMGGVGVFGGVDDPNPSAASSRSGRATSDGGRTTEINSPNDGTEPATAADDGLVLGAEPDHPEMAADSYCGNCSEFDYIQTEAGIEPYCGLHDERMDDMNACEQWTPNR